MGGIINLSRRNFLKTGSMIGGGILFGLSPMGLGRANQKESIVNTPYPLNSLEIFGRGVSKSEGIVIDKDGNVYGGGNNGILYKVTPDGKVHTLTALPEGSIPNGITMDRRGNIIYCDLGRQAVMRVTQGGQVSMIADRVGTIALALPNFPAYDADGNLYVSNSSIYDFNTVFTKHNKPEPTGSLVRIRPNGKNDVIATGLFFANGTAIDPREEAVYVLESTRNDCLRIALGKDGSWGKPETFAKDLPGMPDGMAFDEAGNLYVTLVATVKDGQYVPANKIIRVDRNGNWTLLIDDAAGQKLARPTNCAFGGPDGKDLYIANALGDHFARVHTSFRGHPLYHQR